MSLYHEVADALKKTHEGAGSLKSVVFGQKDAKSDGKTRFALSAESAKWSEVLTEIIDRTELLKVEKQISPYLALVLVHDFLFSKKGLAITPKHGLHVAISKHKARLNAELTRARLRRGFASLDDLRASINNTTVETTNSNNSKHPRWIRINTLRTSLGKQLSTTFSGYKRTKELSKVANAAPSTRIIWIDQHVPDLIAVPYFEAAKNEAYKAGELILQDKASCFPAYLLDPGEGDGTILDACAAPGNKTTHLAALSRASTTTTVTSDKLLVDTHPPRIIACERDPARAKVLQSMIILTGASPMVEVIAKQDFLKLDPKSRKFANVTALLLDPSCSGSGIVGRDESTLTIHLPSSGKGSLTNTSRKRKRGSEVTISSEKINIEGGVEEHDDGPVSKDQKLQDRLTALSAFQLRVIEHAMSFPAATKIVYSTCSVHGEENEQVVVKALLSDIAARRGWRILRREEQVSGIRTWSHRGDSECITRTLQAQNHDGNATSALNAEDIAEGCVRCHKAGNDYTMGFFLAGFIRNGNSTETNTYSGEENLESPQEESAEDWSGFSDEESMA